MQGISKHIVKGLVAAIIAAAPAASLKAEGWRWGGMVGIASPTGDFSDIANTGFGLSFIGEYSLNDKMGIRGRLGYTLFGGESMNTILGKYEYEPSTTTIFADFVYGFNTMDTGFYVLGGVGYVSASITTKWGGYSTSSSESDLGCAVGAGYNFTSNMGAELKYTKPFGDKIDKWTWIEASFVYRF